MKIYLAGQIEYGAKFDLRMGQSSLFGGVPDDWRVDIIGRHARINEKFRGSDSYPVVKNAILGGHDYVGPFYSGHHNVDPTISPTPHQQYEMYNMSAGFGISSRDLVAIESADMIFAWLESDECYGTIFEIGYAVAMGKMVGLGYEPDKDFNELWFIMASVLNCGGVVSVQNSPRDALIGTFDHYGFRITSYGGYESYSDYLASEHWQAVRHEALQRYDGKCALDSNHAQAVHVHHRTYERLGAELPEDVIVLCADCHAKHHDKEAAR